MLGKKEYANEFKKLTNLTQYKFLSLKTFKSFTKGTR